MQKLDGTLVSQAIRDDLKKKVLALRQQGKRAPHLAAILVGDDGGSKNTYLAYVARQ